MTALYYPQHLGMKNSIEKGMSLLLKKQQNMTNSEYSPLVNDCETVSGDDNRRSGVTTSSPPSQCKLIGVSLVAVGLVGVIAIVAIATQPSSQQQARKSFSRHYRSSVSLPAGVSLGSTTIYN